MQVFAYGDLHYYGANGELNPKKEDGRHCSTCDVKWECAYYSRWHTRSADTKVKDDHIGTVEGSYTGYSPDACIFDSDIDIEDVYTVTVKYDKGALLSYSVNFQLTMKGTAWRLTAREAGLKRPNTIKENRTINISELLKA